MILQNSTEFVGLSLYECLCKSVAAAVRHNVFGGTASLAPEDFERLLRELVATHNPTFEVQATGAERCSIQLYACGHRVLVSVGDQQEQGTLYLPERK